MSYPIPPGTRDILPDEMRELRALSNSLLGTFERFGYGEVWTPTLEYEDVLVTGDERAAGGRYRLFDELEERVAELGVSGKRRETLVALPQLRGGAEVLDRAIEMGGDDVRQATQRLRDVAAGVTARGFEERVIFDLGLVRDLGYYTG